MNAPIFDQLNLVVKDMEATLRFYRAAGLNIPEDTVWRTASGAHHVQVEMPNGIDLEFDSPALAEVYNRGWNAASSGTGNCVLTLRVGSREDVDAVHTRLTALGYATSQPPFDTFWGARYAILLDPDGNHVGFMSQSDPKRRSPPPNL